MLVVPGMELNFSLGNCWILEEDDKQGVSKWMNLLSCDNSNPLTLIW